MESQIMARVEDWTFETGFYYVFGNVAGVPNPFTDRTPQSVEGDAIDVVCSCYAMVKPRGKV